MDKRSNTAGSRKAPYEALGLMSRVDNTRVLPAIPRAKPLTLTAVQRDFLDLIERRAAGHMGKWEYSNGGMKLWKEFLLKNQDYYIPLQDRALIERCASVSANLLKTSGISKVTLVSRGPGSQFDAKEGALIRAFEVAGIEVAKVIYIDVSQSALTQSKKEGKLLLPHARHQIVKADMFDPSIKSQYRIIGMEVGTCFGLTPMNVEGGHDGTPPTTAIEENLTAFRKQMRKGSHFIATYDHNQDAKSIEAAYRGQGDFAKHMLEYHLKWKNTNDIDFVVEYNEVSHILAHGFNFTKERSFDIAGRDKTISAGTTFWFNNSVKLTQQETEILHEQAGFYYPIPERVIMSDNGRLGWHHTSV